MKKKRIGLYPGSFDPVTNGHLDIIFRAHKLVDKLVIGVATNQKKNNLLNSKVKEIMTKNPISIEKDSLAVSALSIMNSRKITSLCVHRKKKIKKTIGLIHMHDILRSNIN